MTRSIIYTVDGAGKLVAMRPSEPRSEDFMQKLVAMHPELISDQDGALLLIRREQPIADREEGGGRWSLDHLFVTRSGIPVLVELKRAVDTRLRREVVGQMLDYAANGTAYWQGGRIAESFAATAAEQDRDPDEELERFLGTGSDPNQFWEQVDANFAAGRIKMVFVADTIPRELARIVEFLNEQMRADVRAVELSWFEGEGVTALTPRVIGETERAQNEKAARAALPKISRDEWIEKHFASVGPETVAAAHSYIDLVAEAGGHAELTRAQGSIIAVFDLPGDTLYPLTMTWQRKGMVQLCLAYLVSRPAFADESVRKDVYDRLSAIVGPLSTASLTGYPGFPLTKLNDQAIRQGVRDLLIHVRQPAPTRCRSRRATSALAWSRTDMRRIDRQQLRDSFHIKIKTMRQGKNGRGRHLMPELSDDYAAGMLAASLVGIVDGRSRMVISTDEKPQSHGVCGVWGVD